MNDVNHLLSATFHAVMQDLWKQSFWCYHTLHVQATIQYPNQFIEKKNKQTRHSSLACTHPKNSIIFYLMHEVRMKLPMEMQNIWSEIPSSCMDVRIIYNHIIHIRHIHRVMHLTLFLRFLCRIICFIFSTIKIFIFHLFIRCWHLKWMSLLAWVYACVCWFVCSNEYHEYTLPKGGAHHFVWHWNRFILIADDFLRSQKWKMGQKI